MRKVLSFFALAFLVALGSFAAPPPAPEPQTPAVADPCAVPASVLPGVNPTPSFMASTCGPCSDPGCPGQSVGSFCTPDGGGIGLCTGAFVGTQPVLCPGSDVLRCFCVGLNN